MRTKDIAVKKGSVPLHLAMPAAPRTPEQVRTEFRRKGITFAQWARQHNVSRHLVAQILSAKRPCNYGESHRIAVLLGLKEGEIAS